MKNYLLSSNCKFLFMSNSLFWALFGFYSQAIFPSNLAPFQKPQSRTPKNPSKEEQECSNFIQSVPQNKMCPPSHNFSSKVVLSLNPEKKALEIARKKRTVGDVIELVYQAFKISLTFCNICKFSSQKKNQNLFHSTDKKPLSISGKYLSKKKTTLYPYLWRNF